MIDPEKAGRNEKSNVLLWSKLNTVDNKTIKMVVNPKIIDKDKKACEHVLSKMLQEKISHDRKLSYKEHQRYV